MSARTCTVDLCKKPYVARGMCRTHYGIWYENDHPRDRRIWRKKYEAENRDKVLVWKRKSSAAYRVRNPEQHRRDALPRNYGITQADYERMLAAQGGTCGLWDVAEVPGKRLDIDHDAKTGRVRGLLCRSHNMGLGYFQDSPELLRAAADYLEAVR